MKNYDAFMRPTDGQKPGAAARVLVPLCGKTVDMPYLAQKGERQGPRDYLPLSACVSPSCSSLGRSIPINQGRRTWGRTRVCRRLDKAGYPGMAGPVEPTIEASPKRRAVTRFQLCLLWRLLKVIRRY